MEAAEAGDAGVLHARLATPEGRPKTLRDAAQAVVDGTIEALHPAELLAELTVFVEQLGHMRHVIQHATHARAALLYMVEPNAGMRKVKATLNEKEPGGKVWDAATRAYVVAERDAVAVAAHHELVSGEAEVRPCAGWLHSFRSIPIDTC